MKLDPLRFGLAGLRRSGKNLLRARFGLRRLTGYLTWRRRCSPDFLILGAQKAGTTALFAYLCECREMQPPERFELHYFDTAFWKGYRWYLSHFPLRALDGQNTVTGEKSPYYLFHPHAPPRVLSTVPDCRFIVLLRNPVERTYSHFQHSREQGFETLSFEEALGREEERLRGEEVLLRDPRYVSFAHQRYSYVSRSLYADQLERWFRYFPRDRFLILQSERLFSRPDEALDRVFAFLGIRSEDPSRFVPRNVGGYTPLSEEVHKHLEERFEPHNERLFELLGRRFDWD